MDLIKRILACFIIALPLICLSSEVVVDTAEYDLDYGDSDDVDYYENYVDELKSDDTGFLCSDKKYIVSYYLCDGFWDCDDGADEDPSVCEDYGIEPFSSTTPTTVSTTTEPIDLEINDFDLEQSICSEQEFMCKLTQDLCIPAESRCDGYMDCPNGEDEKLCEFLQPSEDYFDVHDEYDDTTKENYDASSSIPDRDDLDVNEIDLDSRKRNKNGLMNRLLNITQLGSTDSNSSKFRFIHLREPKKVKKISKQIDTASLEAVLREAAYPDLASTKNSKLTGESGKTEDSKHFIHITKMTDTEAEKFLESQNDVSPLETKHRNSLPLKRTTPNTTPSTIKTTMKPSVEIPSHPVHPKRVKNSKRKLLKLANKLIRKLSKSLRTNLYQRNSKVRIEINLDNSDQSEKNHRALKDPKITVHFETTL